MENIYFVVSQGKICDIDSIVQFQADMAMESEGCVLNKEKVIKELLPPCSMILKASIGWLNMREELLEV